MGHDVGTQTGYQRLVIWLLGPLVGIVAALLALQWALRSHRNERRPWLAVLGTPASTAAISGGRGTVEGVASDEGGSIPPIQAPFTGRPCLGYHIEIIVQEMFGNQTTWQRAFHDGAGHCALISPDGRRAAEVDLQGAGVIFPLELTAYSKLSWVVSPDTVFQGTLAQLPENLGWFVHRLPVTAHQLVMRPGRQLFGAGKRVYFNERIIVPGVSVVVMGHAEGDASGLRMVPDAHGPVRFALGSALAETRRVAKLPVASEAFGAVFAGILASILVMMVIGMTSK